MKTKGFAIRSDRVRLFLKWISYVFLALVCYLYMTTSVGTSVKPLVLIPLALCISMRESELLSSLTGLVCGLLTDAACGKVMGYNALLLMILCMFAALLFLYWMRQNIINVLFVTAVGTILLGVLDFFFYYGIWGYKQVELLFWQNTFPGILLTIASCVPLYFAVKWIDRLFGIRKEQHIEEKSENIVRE